MLRSWIITRAKVRPSVEANSLQHHHAQLDASSAVGIKEGALDDDKEIFSRTSW